MYRLRHPVRFVTAASLFDGHDVTINIIRRVLQASGAEVVHLGHNRSVEEIVETALQEDVQGIAVSSYQGGHVEYLTFLMDRLREAQADHIKVFAGGGGVIADREIAFLEAYGVSKVFSVDDGMNLGLQGMIDIMLRRCDYALSPVNGAAGSCAMRALARHLTLIEAGSHDSLETAAAKRPTVGITGTGGAGKSTLTDELVRRLLIDFKDIRIAVLSVDPTRRRTGGALLGDRIRMNALYGGLARGANGQPRVFMRSFATRRAHSATSDALEWSIMACRSAGYDLIIVETAGIGQSDTEISDLVDVSLYVMTHDFGAPTQLEKIGMLDAADFVVINKFDRRGSLDALRGVRKQVQRNRLAFSVPVEEMPVYPTTASRFNDEGVTELYLRILEALRETATFARTSQTIASEAGSAIMPQPDAIIPAHRQRYLGEIAESTRAYRAWVDVQVDVARKWGQAVGARRQVEEWAPEDGDSLRERLQAMEAHWWDRLDSRCKNILEEWDRLAEAYRKDEFTYEVRGQQIRLPLHVTSLSGLSIPRVAVPRTQDPGERVRFALLENLPGYFPFTAGVFPFKRTGEDPTRMFAGEGCPERTNLRFHLVSSGMEAKRLSTAFDSVTLYGFDPELRPDIYGKIGNSGVSVCTLDDMKKLFSGFDLMDPKTSVSMTINGPAPMILAMFFNTVIDQRVEQHLRDSGEWPDARRIIEEHLAEDGPQYIGFSPNGRQEALPPGHDGRGLGLLGCCGSDLVEWGLLSSEVYQALAADALTAVRGTVQADILKEDQAQNTCIFSTELALRMMGDMQQYFIDHEVRNFYSVSISGYHIAEAGANPVTQLAFTLTNAFTYVEYYLSRGMDVDRFAPNLSFFFSNGMDPEYSVIGRVARRIWAVAMRERYGANKRSQKLKYHVQTSGRSLHAQEIQFNDIRTTLQALYAIYDNCNSLHTNAYDEAITTPTEESVRRAIAIQLIINRELGQAKNENPLQGSFIIEELTDLVEEAVLAEFERINDRGGVLGAMEMMYQRGKIQEESLHYERQKISGALPVVGVNMYTVEAGGSAASTPEEERMTSSEAEKQHQLANLRTYQERHAGRADQALRHLEAVARQRGNTFEALMHTVRVCSLGQISQALFNAGGQYRRNM